MVAIQDKETRTLIVTQERHRQLSQIKLDNDFKSIDEVIEELLKNYKPKKK